MPTTELYTFRASDGVDYEATADQLQDWLKSGRVRKDDTITNFLNGQKYMVAEVLSMDLPSPSIPAQFAEYPRNQLVAALPIEMTGGFNWGAFVFTWIWGLNHKKPILLLAFLSIIPILGLIVAIWGGTKGNQWAWESGRFKTGADCKKCQEIWRNWALGFLAVYLTLILFTLTIRR